jgi:hypothetical protein
MSLLLNNFPQITLIEADQICLNLRLSATSAGKGKEHVLIYNAFS